MYPEKHPKPPNLFNNPYFLTTIACCLGYLVLTQLIETLLCYPIYQVLPMGRGGDFRDFVKHIEQAYAGAPFDLGGRFYKPPFFALIVSLLSQLPIGISISIYQTLSILCLGCVTFLICNLFKTGKIAAVLIFAAVLTSYPGSFLIDRCNVEALALAASFLGFYLLTMQRGLLLPSLLIVLAYNLKTNMLVFVPIFIIIGTHVDVLKKCLLLFFISILFFMLTPDWSIEWINVLKNRSTLTQLSWEVENGSIYRVFGHSIDPQATRVILGHIFNLLFFSTIAAGLLKNNLLGRGKPIYSFLLALPLCAAFPLVAYAYSQVLIPLLLLLYSSVAVSNNSKKLAKFASLLGCLGIVLSCFPTLFTIAAFETLGFGSELWNFMPQAWGLLFTLIANSLIAWIVDPTQLQSEFGYFSDREREKSNWLEISIIAILYLFFISTLIAASISTYRWYFLNSNQTLWLPKPSGEVVATTR